jgi:diguanylate cyclase (GGDEF)-like protein
MLFWVKIITDVANIGLGCIILYTGYHIFSSFRLSLQQKSARLFVAAALLFTIHEILFLAPEQTLAIRIAHEILQTGFVACLCLAMTSIARSQKTELTDLHRLAEIDHLTDLQNLSAFRRQALHSIKHRHNGRPSAMDAYGPVAVLMIDIDFFKSYNDSFGHEEGNVALQTVARVIRDATRQNDMVGRYGGEEFIALLLSSPRDAVMTAERIRAKVEAECSPEFTPSLQRQLTVSVGVALSTIEQCTLPSDELLDELVKVADYELYRAKRSGRNCISASVDMEALPALGV